MVTTSFLVICKCSMSGDDDVAGPYYNKFSDIFNTTYFDGNAGYIKDQTYYCVKNEYDHYGVFCNNINGSYNCIFTEKSFNKYFYSEKELRKEKLKKLNEKIR